METTGMFELRGWIFIGCLLTSAGLRAEGVAGNAARYICETAAAAKLPAVAVFPFTDGEKRETATTRRATTSVLSGVLACGLKVIDRSKIKDVLREQVRRQSGLYDEASLPAIGRLAGADALVYGTLDGEALQIRLVDARSGAMLGASVQDGTGGRANPEAAVTAAREELKLDQLNAWLEELSQSDPQLFVYVTSTKEEFAEYVEEQPAAAGRLLDRVEAFSPEKRAKLGRMKREVRRLIADHPRVKNGVRRWQRRIRRKAVATGRPAGAQASGDRSPKVQRLKRVSRKNRPTDRRRDSKDDRRRR